MPTGRPPLPGPDELLAALRPLRHSDRWRLLSTLGAAWAGTPELRRLLDALDGDAHRWQLRLVAAGAARSVPDVAAGLTHPDRSVRSLAMTQLAVVPVPADTVVAAAASMASADRHALISVIRRHHLTGLADPVVAVVADRYGLREASALLPACSRPVVDAWLPVVEHAVDCWGALARSHPGPVGGVLGERLTGEPVATGPWWERLGAAVGPLVEHDPDLVLDLWPDHHPAGIPAALRRCLRRLLVLRPDRTVALLLRPPLRPHLPQRHPSLASGHPRQADHHHGALAAATLDVDHQVTVALLLGRVAPSRREALFERAVGHLDRGSLHLSEALLAVLPRATRRREAERLAARAERRGDQAARLDLLPHLPTDRVWDELVAATGASDAALRGRAYQRLVAAVASDPNPAAVARLLDHLDRLVNDQDPVRQKALQALSTFPTTALGPDHLPSLQRLVSATVEARDSSWSTKAALSLLLERLLASAATPERRALLTPCVDALVRLGGVGGLSPRLADTLPAGGDTLLIAALEPRLRNDVAAERYQLLFSLVRTLGRRADRNDALQELLWQVADCRLHHSAIEAMALWLRPRGQRTERVARLIEREPSVVATEPVFRTLALARQDLLDRALTPVRGRFANPDRDVVLLSDGGFHRWHPDQTAAYATLIVRAIDNEDEEEWRKAAAVRTLSLVPGGLDPHARRLLADPSVNVVEATIAGLARIQQPAAVLGYLLSQTSGDRARVASPAAALAARATPPDQLLIRIREVLTAGTTRLTARKEAVRILGLNRPAGWLDTLAELWSHEPLHPDLTIALAGALREVPDDKLTWSVLHSLASDGSDEALGLLALTADLLPWPTRHRPRLVDLVIPLTAHPSVEVASRAWASLAAWFPWSSEPAGRLCRAIADLDRRTDLRPALNQLTALVDGAPAAGLPLRVVEGLLAAAPPPDSDAGADRDLPIQQRLGLVARIGALTGAGSASLAAAGERLRATRYGDAAVNLLAAGIDWSDPTPQLERLAALGRSRPDAVPSLSAVLGRARSPVAEACWTPDSLLAPATGLVEAGSEPDAVLALALIQAAGVRAGWPEPWRLLLRRVRAHPGPYVSWLSRQVTTANEVI